MIIATIIRMIYRMFSGRDQDQDGAGAGAGRRSRRGG